MGRRTKAIILLGFLIGFVGIGFALSVIPVPISDGVTLGAPDGANITINGNADIDLEDFTSGSDTLVINTSTSGNFSATSSGPAWAEIAASDITGTYTVATNIDVTQNDLTINPEDKPAATVGGSITSFEWRDGMQADDGTDDFRYSASSDTNTITVTTSEPDTTLQAVDPATNTVVGKATTDSSGVATFSNLDNGTHDIRLQTNQGAPTLSNLQDDGSIRFENQTLSVDVDDPDYPQETVTLEWYVDGNLENTTTANTAGTYSAVVGPIADGSHDYYVVATDGAGASTQSSTQSFTIDHHDAQISDISPSGDLDFEPSQISAQINDTDFAKDGDELTVTIDLDGSQIHSETIQSNGTVSTSIPSSGQTGGAHDIEVSATDDYGQTETNQTTYNVPDALFIRNELNHSELIPADGEVRFFGTDQVYSRSAPNGIVNMTNLPINQEMIVEVEPTDSTNFTERTFYLKSIYQQESVYVLDTREATTVQTRFVLNDPTGRYDSSSRLRIQKPINISGNVTYQSVVIDRFGAEGVTATLQKGQRYQLVVASDTNTQEIGPYRGELNETVQVVPGTAEVPIEDGPQPWDAGATIDNTTISWAYSDVEQETQELVVFIHERNNKSNTAQANQTYTDIGNVSGSVDVGVNESDNEWVVTYVITRNGETFVHPVYTSNRNNLLPPIDSGWSSMIGIGLLILLAGAFSVLNAGIGAVIVSLVGGVLWFIGFLGGATSAAAIAIALLVSIIGHAISSTR